MSDMASLQAEGPSAGTLLRRARESAGLHVAALAVALKVPVRKLEALEADRHDLLPDAVFARALASSVCRQLKIDPQPILQRLPQSAPRLATDSAGLNTPFRVPGERVGPDWAAPLMRPVGMAVAALLVGAVVIALVPLPGRQAQPTPAAQPAAASQAEPMLPPGTPATVTLVSSEPVAAPAAAGSAPVADSAAAILPAVAAQPVAAVQPAVAASATQVPASRAAVSASGVVVFRTRAPSWIQVTDARGTTVLQRLMEPGESAGASGALPLSVVVGSAGTTEVQVRGKPFNLAPMTRDNVARFEVK